MDFVAPVHATAALLPLTLVHTSLTPVFGISPIVVR